MDNRDYPDLSVIALEGERDRARHFLAIGYDIGEALAAIGRFFGRAISAAGDAGHAPPGRGA